MVGSSWISKVAMMASLARLRNRSPLFVASLAILAAVGVSAANRTLNAHLNEHRKQQDHRNIQALNSLVSEYRKTRGTNPDLNLIELYRAGLTKRRLVESPMGGYYRLDPNAGTVFSPNHLETHPTLCGQ